MICKNKEVFALEKIDPNLTGLRPDIIMIFTNNILFSSVRKIFLQSGKMKVLLCFVCFCFIFIIIIINFRYLRIYNCSLSS